MTSPEDVPATSRVAQGRGYTELLHRTHSTSFRRRHGAKEIIRSRDVAGARPLHALGCDDTPLGASWNRSSREKDPMSNYAELPNLIAKTDGVHYAYRDTGGEGLPLLLLQHFRGNLDNWDPKLMDALADSKRVITFDNVGVGGSSGEVPSTIAEMAAGAVGFIEAMELEKVDLLGFSIGSFVAQEIALVRPSIVNGVVLASSAPKGASKMHGWSPEVIGAVGARDPGPEAYLGVFFTQSGASKKAGGEVLQRIYGRTEDRDAPTSWDCRLAQYDAVCEWGIPNQALLERLEAIQMPVFVAAGDSDPMILPRYSFLLAGILPDARVKIYDDSAHGFLFQYYSQFAQDVETFLGS
jgi:pimeloyl-ACP methyl ester carboxylesterase